MTPGSVGHFVRSDWGKPHRYLLGWLEPSETIKGAGRPNEWVSLRSAHPTRYASLLD